ncbi:MAG TPA: hypothetical protein VFS43_29725 [Polyangiaceae bacterium]|nr:hypothetical protein [Polyangiaceae bacterium]
MTEFRASVLGTAGAVLRAAGSIFGGWASSAGRSAYEVQRAVGGGAHDEALREAVEGARPHVHQCPRCGQWVCHHPCWNGLAALCTGCAPEFQGEVAAAHADAKAQAARRQLYEKAQATDYVGGVSMAPDAVYAAPRTLGQGPPAPGSARARLRRPPARPRPAFAPAGRVRPRGPGRALRRLRRRHRGCEILPRVRHPRAPARPSVRRVRPAARASDEVLRRVRREDGVKVRTTRSPARGRCPARRWG